MRAMRRRRAAPPRRAPAGRFLTLAMMVMALVMLAFLHKTAEGLDRNNVLFVLTDDQDIVLGSMDPEGPMQKTRKLVVEKGAWFANGFATTPICCPSRAEITSGRYMHNTEVYGNDCGGMAWVEGPEKLNMATYMKAKGYTTFYAGKYLNNYGSPKVGGCAHVPPGWDQWYGLVGNSKYYNYNVCTGNNETETHGSDYATDYFTDRIANRTLDFLDNVTSHGSPFFAMLGTPASHGPNDPAPQYSETYAGRKSPRLPSWNVAPNPDKHFMMRHILPMDEQHANVSDVFFQRRWSVLRSVDDMVARLLGFLETQGVLAHTFVIFTGDHGYHLGEFGMLYDKRMLYETDIRVPLFVSGPGIKGSQTIEQPVGHIDLAPTILSMAGIPAPPQMDGRSWLPLVYGEDEATSAVTAAAGSWRTTFMVEYSGGGLPAVTSSRGVLGEEAAWEESHFAHSFASTLYPPGFQALCGANASDELSIWGKCSCSVDAGWHGASGPNAKAHDQSPCDSNNNTFACIRTIELKQDARTPSLRTEAEITAQGGNGTYEQNWIYCEFEDSENFKEYYDLNADPYNLHNVYTQLSTSRQTALAQLLAKHRACKGQECFHPSLDATTGQPASTRASI